jgi:hypothetical protein
MFSSQMVQHYQIGVENHILIGADILNYITDLLGQLVLVRCILCHLLTFQHSQPLIDIPLLVHMGETFLRHCAPYAHVIYFVLYVPNAMVSFGID